MTRFFYSALSLSISFLAFGVPAALAAGENSAQLKASYAAIPLIFEPNQGQTDRSVLFMSRNRGFTLFLTASEAVIRFPGKHDKKGPEALSRSAGVSDAKAKVLRIEWVGAQPGVQAAGLEPLPGKSNYFRGKDPQRWIRGVQHYAKARLSSVYPGIDLRYYDRGSRELELDWDVSAGSDPKQIALRLTGMQACSLDAQGNVLVDMGDGQSFGLKAPTAYQLLAGQRRGVEAAYELSGDRIGIKLGAYDAARPLVIDPVLAYSTYLGGADYDVGTGIAVDGNGDALVVGYTSSANFPRVNALQSTPYGGEDVFLSKLDPGGSSLLFSTYLGGTLGYPDSEGYAVAVDANGDAYITGVTNAYDFPLVNAFQWTCSPCASYSGGGNAFVSKVRSDGAALLYSTYLGGSGMPYYSYFTQGDSGTGIAVDQSGSAYVVGATFSQDFPVQGALQPSCGACLTWTASANAFISKLSPYGNALLYSTYLGLAADCRATGVAVDPAGEACVSGSGAAPLVNPLSTSGSGFVCKLNASGSALIYSTRLKGTVNAQAVAVDSGGNAYVTGKANSGLSLVSAFQSSPNIGQAFVSKLDPSGSSFLYSTYLGGCCGASYLQNQGNGIAVDSLGSAYVTGWTGSPVFPLLGAFQTVCSACVSNNATDAFVSKLSPGGNALVYSSYLGGSGQTYPYGQSVGDEGLAIALDGSGNAYVTGQTASSDFPAFGALRPYLAGNQNAFVAKLLPFVPAPTATFSITPTFSPSPTFTLSPTISPTFTISATFSVSPTRTPSASATPTRTRTPSPTPSRTPLLVATATPAATLAVGPSSDSFSIVGIFPNPVTGDGTHFGLDLGYQADVRLTVYTVSGEPVYSYTWPGLAQGKQQLFWDARNSSGLPLGAGAYYLDFSALGSGRTLKAGRWISVLK